MATRRLDAGGLEFVQEALHQRGLSGAGDTAYMDGSKATGLDVGKRAP